MANTIDVGRSWARSPRSPPKPLEHDRAIAYARGPLIVWIRVDMVYEDGVHLIGGIGH